MNVVFLNTLEKKVGEERVKSAQVSIGEKQGIWHTYWSEPDAAGKLVQESWYEGTSWDELLTSFRLCLKEKIRLGFHPLVNGTWEQAQPLSGKAKMTQILNYFCELNANDDAYETLRKWRREQSAREGKAPYILATNRVLRLISVFLPQTPEELVQIPGFGEQKTAVYGGDLLKLTQEFPRTTTFPLDWVARSVDMSDFEAWVELQKEQKMRMEMDKETDKRKLLESVARGEGLDDLQAGISMMRRELLLWVEELDREGYDMEPLIEAELQAVSEEDQIKAWTAFELEGDRYLKPVLHRIYSADELKVKDQDRVYEWLRLLRLRFRREKESMRSQVS